MRKKITITKTRTTRKSAPAPNTTASGRYLIPCENTKQYNKMVTALRNAGIEFDEQLIDESTWQHRHYPQNYRTPIVNETTASCIEIRFGSYRIPIQEQEQEVTAACPSENPF